MIAVALLGIAITLLILSLTLIAGGAVDVVELWKRRPMSDEEFVARCSPGTDPQVALKVRRIIADQLGVDDELIRPDTDFVRDLGCG